MNAEILGFVIYVKAIIYLLLCDLHDCFFSIFYYDFILAREEKVLWFHHFKYVQLFFLKK